MSQLNVKAATLIVSGRVVEVFDPPENKGYGDNALLFLPASMHPHYQKLSISVETVFKGKYEKPMVFAYAKTFGDCGLSLNQIKKMDFFLLYQDHLIEVGKYYELGGKCQVIISKEDKGALLATVE